MSLTNSIIVSLTLACASMAQTSLRVQVNDPSGRAVPGASVTLAQPASPPKPARTDVQRQYVFRNLEPGEYRVSVAANGFATVDLPRYEIAAAALKRSPCRWCSPPRLKGSP